MRGQRMSNHTSLRGPRDSTPRMEFLTQWFTKENEHQKSWRKFSLNIYTWVHPRPWRRKFKEGDHVSIVLKVSQVKWVVFHLTSWAVKGEAEDKVDHPPSSLVCLVPAVIPCLILLSPLYGLIRQLAILKSHISTLRSLWLFFTSQFSWLFWRVIP